MRMKWPVLLALLSIGTAYAAYPYVTLYRLGSAIRGGNSKVLEALVDWPAVREGIKEDVCDLVAAEPGPKTGAELLPFGTSFMRGIASSAIDQAVTPRALLAATATLPSKQPAQNGADVRLRWAFFDSLTTFMVSLRAQGQSEPITVEMDLRHGKWRVQRVWLPADMLSNAPAKT